jgi:hypothetical protein
VQIKFIIITRESFEHVFFQPQEDADKKKVQIVSVFLQKSARQKKK